MRTFEIIDGAIAASGTNERGVHINDPYTGMIAIGAASATVVGPFGWLRGGLVIVLIAAGEAGAKHFTPA
jgi:thiamine biosynthesis lipoprotein